MTAVLVLAGLVVGGCAVLACLVVRGWLADRRRRVESVRIHLRGDAPSISGFLRGRRGGHYVVELAKMHESVDGASPLAGIVEIPERQVVFLQRLPA